LGGRTREAQSVPPVIERFMKQLVVTYKAVCLYPPSSTIPRDNAYAAVVALRDALQTEPELRLAVTKDGLLWEGSPLFPGQSAFTSFARELYNHNLAEVRFHSGAQPKDLTALLSVLKDDPADVQAAGGFELRLWEQGVDSVTVTLAHVTLVESDTQAPAAGPASAVEVDEALAAALAGNRDNRLLGRLIGDREAMREYMTRAYVSGDEESPFGDRTINELARIVAELPADERPRLLDSLAQAIMGLPAEERHQLVAEHLLVDARSDDAVASVMRQLDVDEVCRVLVEGLKDSRESLEGLARAIRNLAMISIADREDVVNAAGAAMRGAGVSEDAVDDVLEMAHPSRLAVRDGAPAAAATERPPDPIFELLDLAPLQKPTIGEGDPMIDALREEARKGLTDGDVIGAMVTLVGLDHRETPFGQMMSLLEDSIDLLVDRGEIEIAADVTDAMLATAEAEDLSDVQRARARKAVGRFARPAAVRAVLSALRLYAEGSDEYEAARRLLVTLGGRVIEPLLELLADEPDMAVRKSLVDLLAGIAGDYIPELGAHLSDQRWFVVRNVITVLGSTKKSAALPYMERTLRHGDSRVRRETIRSLSLIHDRRAVEMLKAALSDDDPQNVQLAARYLGMSGERGAIPSLVEVARGDGRGNRDISARVESVEALGRLGDESTMPILESLATKRAIIGAGRTRELRVAAESAMSRIRAREHAQRREEDLA